MKNVRVTCPECDAEVDLPDDAEVNDMVSCEECGLDLEIINMNPPEVEIAEEEDYDDEDY